MSPHVPSVFIEVSPGELIDKLSILQIKLKKVSDPAKFKNAKVEYDILNQCCSEQVPRSVELDQLAEDLRRVNECLWEVEDELRLCEQQGSFGDAFIGLARKVYLQNDRRAQLKHQINLHLGAKILEVKVHPPYRTPGSGSDQ